MFPPAPEWTEDPTSPAPHTHETPNLTREYILENLQREENRLSYHVRGLAKIQARIDYLRTALAHLPH